MRKYLFLILLGALFVSRILCGAENIQDLNEWKRLLHFSDYKSRIVSSGFFLAEDGGNDPISELNATIDLLNSKNGAVVASNYPARYLWLRGHGYSVPEFDLESFSDLNDYVEAFKKQKIYLIFASEYTGCSASFFGHILLGFSGEDSLLDADVIHFSAETDDGASGFLKYAYNGLTGKYESYFYR